MFKLVEAVSYPSSRERRNELVEILVTICDVCWSEYQFSYGDGYISHLLYLREDLKRFKKTNSQLAGEIIKGAIEKLEILLAKLSAYSDDKQIVTNFDFNLETFEIGNIDKYSENDFRRLFQEYLEPKLIDKETICKWQENSHKNPVKMWQMAMLIRYYTKVSKSKQQIEHLIEIEEKHHKECIEGDGENLVNKYAERTFRNYMWNSLFSFLCQNDDDYDYIKMKDDLGTIQAIQNESFFYSYHPYEHAIDYCLNYIEDEIANLADKKKLKEILHFIQDIFDKFKDKVEWCKRNLPYLMQMRYNFSSIDSENKSFKIFCPSSFCRPLRFSVLDDMKTQYNNRISMLTYQIEHIDERRNFQEATTEIKQIEKKNIKYMGLYASVMTFLVGLLSIFIGNTGEVKLTDRIQFVITLGFILIVFTCVGYFSMSNKFDKWKPYIFLLILVASLIGIIRLV